MTASTASGPNGELSSGISPDILALPRGLSQRTLLVVEPGINRAFDTWGQALTALGGKTPCYDFAGGTVVHITSGVSALVTALYLGKRLG